MAFLECNISSSALGMSTTFNVVLPQPAFDPKGKAGKPKPLPVLYLLHGFSDDQTMWMRRTSVERYAEQFRVAVVMPDGAHSFYSNMAHGQRYWNYVSEELPAIVKGMFPVSHKRQDTFVAGLSMGGYGALKLALSHPGRYAAAASFSGAVDVAGWMKADGDRNGPWIEWGDIFGSVKELRKNGNDLLLLAQKAAKAKQKPKLFQACGRQDMLYQDNLKFRDHLKKLGFSLDYHEEDANHEWAFWDRMISRTLPWLFQK